MSLYLGSNLVVPTVEGDGTSSTPILQTKTGISPTTSSQLITFDSGYDGLESVQINAMETIVPPSTMSSTSSGVYRATLSPGSSVQYLNIPVGYNNTAMYYTIPIGSGATNIAQGTFTTSSTTGSNQDITLNYSGSGYPIFAAVWVSPDMYNNSTWYETIQRYAVGAWFMLKAYANDTPTYSTSGNANTGLTFTRYKSSTSTASSMSNSTGATTNTFSSSNAASAAATCARFTSSTNLSIRVASTSYGFMAGIAHKYIVVYSS